MKQGKKFTAFKKKKKKERKEEKKLTLPGN